MAKRTTKNLDTYRAKRSAGATPEPFGSRAAARPHLFVVQKHDATRLHYDFRLEWGGTLVSWAVPKGPSLNPEDKRYAVHVEDHPVEYADFEGVIPKGNYGAGPVIVWDRGLWVPLDDPDQGLAEGKLHFELHGYKLRGIFLLIKLKGKDASPKDWLLRKKPDGYATADPPRYSEASILSGLTLEELAQGKTRAAALRRKLVKLKAPARPVDPRKLKPMLAETADAPFSDPEWVYELKYDGYRLTASKDPDGSPYLRSRNGHDVTAQYPELALAVRSLPYAGFILDGEMVVLDDDGRPNFQKLQRRSKLTRPRDVERATVELPVTLFTFDLPGFEGFDLRNLPLTARKDILRGMLPGEGPLRYCEHVPEHGEAMFDTVTQMKLEGIMAKKADSPYLSKRSKWWLKVPADKSADFVVCGYTEGKGTRIGLGALHLGAYQGDTLVYAGRAGTGFTDTQLEDLRTALEPERIDVPACAGAVPTGPDHFWVRPEHVVEVRYKTLTDSGMLRHPVFLRLRDDKAPEDCPWPGWESGDPPPGESAPPPAEAAAVDKHVQISNPDKVFWPDAGYTKGDLVAYYEWVWPWIEPYLKDRPMVLTRYPDGIEGKSFYQKNVPDFLPKWMRTESMWSESSGREIRYLVCDDLESLLWIVNSAAIPLHLWSSRCADLPHPDWCILDLDPKGAPFADVITLAKAIRALCDEIGLPSYPKTSGSTGLHVLVPLGGQCTYEQSRLLGQLMAQVVESRHRDIGTTVRHIPSRKGRVYLDYLQNRHGQLLVSPYCVRPYPGAPVSAPVTWKEVNSRLDPRKYTIMNLRRRLSSRKPDPMLPVLTERPDLVGALGRLAGLMELA